MIFMIYNIYLNNTIKQQQQESVEWKKRKEESFKKEAMVMCAQCW